ncbi:hypothetical protein H5410_030314 [Solanum commersonii]|uniref:Uncharacterized protein n=1 Tax=Solanum commersonii TaxID=4109 RepID=A0A9J5YH34_SOLCO|nr:hypothetical protein H5410_030314 [Solanum commersonii]
MVHHRLDKLMYLMRISIKKEKIMINYTCKRKITNSAAADGISKAEPHPLFATLCQALLWSVEVESRSETWFTVILNKSDS